MAGLTSAQKTKSRAKLYNLIEGTKKILAPAGQSATGSIQFANQPVEGETVTIGGVTFTFYNSGNEPGADATVEVTIGAGLTNTIDNLITDMLANATTGAWGFLHPVDATALTNTGGTTLDIVFFPGVGGNSVTLAGSAGDETITAPTGGVAAKKISLQHKTTVIDTSASATDVEYYILDNGAYIGQEVTVIFEALGASDTPRILGQFYDTAAKVYVEADTAGEFARWIWTGTYWKPVELVGGVTYTASA